MISIARLRRLLSYNKITGILMWKDAHNPSLKGKRAGCSWGTYRFVVIDGKNYREHRLAWAIVHGQWPPMGIDHRNGDGSDNRLKNLRLATTSQNQRNKKVLKSSLTGIKGVHFRKERNAYIPRIFSNGKLRRLGYFKDIRDAEKAYIRVSKKLWGEYSFAASRGTNL